MRWLIVIVLVCSVPDIQAQEPFIELAKGAVRRVIRAIDLKVQRWQNKTIWLQNAQKELENVLAKTKLDEISGWVEKQRTLYDEYFQELWKVKDLITTYHRVRNITKMQAALAREYQGAFRLFGGDAHFNMDEIAYMRSVYEGILAESLDNLSELGMVVNSFALQMSDGERMRMIADVEVKTRANYDALKEFNKHNALMVLQRAKNSGDGEVIKKMYGFE